MANLTVRPSRHRARRRVLGGPTLALVAMVVAACGGADESASTIRLSQDTPDLAPALEDLAVTDTDANVAELEFASVDGSTRSLSEFIGQPLVINFFAAWCAPCNAEMPDLEQVYQEVKGEVAFLGLAQDRVLDDALDMVDRTGVSYEIGWDPALDVYLEIGGWTMPTTVFVSSAGDVAEVFPGPLTADTIREKIAVIEG